MIRKYSIWFCMALLFFERWFSPHSCLTFCILRASCLLKSVQMLSVCRRYYARFIVMCSILHLLRAAVVSHCTTVHKNIWYVSEWVQFLWAAGKCLTLVNVIIWRDIFTKISTTCRAAIPKKKSFSRTDRRS